MLVVLILLSFTAAGVAYANGNSFVWPALTGGWVFNYLMLQRKYDQASDAVDSILNKYVKK